MREILLGAFALAHMALPTVLSLFKLTFAMGTEMMSVDIARSGNSGDSGNSRIRVNGPSEVSTGLRESDTV